MICRNFLISEDRRELERRVRRQRENHEFARCSNAISLMDYRESCAQISKFLYLDDDTIRGWHSSFREGDWEVLAQDGRQGVHSRMTSSQEALLCTWLEEHFCCSANEVRTYIYNEFAPIYSHSGCLKLLSRLGIEYRKPKALPTITDETVYFADAVHPEYQTRPVLGRVRKGSNHAVKTTAGRRRVNIHGALCRDNFDAPFVESVTVDGDSAVQLLEKIEANIPDEPIIHIILNNAAYHRCQTVKQWLARAKFRLNLIQLPAYCPHLNPNERLWAFLHKYVTHNYFYPTQKRLDEDILRFFRQAIPKIARYFRDLITRQFPHHLPPKLSGFEARAV